MQGREEEVGGVTGWGWGGRPEHMTSQRAGGSKQTAADDKKVFVQSGRPPRSRCSAAAHIPSRCQHEEDHSLARHQRA